MLSPRSGSAAPVRATRSSCVSGPLFLTTSRTSPARMRERDSLIRKSCTVTRTTAPLELVECDEHAERPDAVIAHARRHGRIRAARRSNGVRRRTSCVFGAANTPAHTRKGDPVPARLVEREQRALVLEQETLYV